MEQVASARAEWRWLQGDLEGCAAEASVGDATTIPYHPPMVPKRRSELALAERRVERSAIWSLGTAMSWRSLATGARQSDAWARLGCPWEQALAPPAGRRSGAAGCPGHLSSDSAPRLRQLISKRRLRERGARGLPRGPYASTRANQQGLTNRQVEVLQLLAEGLRDVEIADRLSISRRTAEQHVAGVLMKFNARTRAEAVRRAYELGALP